MGHQSYFVLLPAFKVGLNDSLNPCSFATALILYLYLSAAGRTQVRIFWFGLIFIVSSMTVHYGLTAGLFDPIVTSHIATKVFRVFYLMSAVAFSSIGIVNIIDRWLYEKHCDLTRFKHRIPAFLTSYQRENAKGAEKKFLIVIKFVLLAFIVGALVTLCSSIYPQREYIFIVHSYLMANGNKEFAIMSFFQYSVASTLPLFIVWFAVYAAGMARKKTKVILFSKGVTAALFLSVGVGLGYFLIK